MQDRVAELSACKIRISVLKGFPDLHHSSDSRSQVDKFLVYVKICQSQNSAGWKATTTINLFRRKFFINQYFRLFMCLIHQ